MGRIKQTTVIKYRKSKTKPKHCPVPSTPVYGRTPIFTCPNNNGCGCGNYTTSQFI